MNLFYHRLGEDQLVPVEVIHILQDDGHAHGKSTHLNVNINWS